MSHPEDKISESVLLRSLNHERKGKRMSSQKQYSGSSSSSGSAEMREGRRGRRKIRGVLRRVFTGLIPYRRREQENDDNLFESPLNLTKILRIKKSIYLIYSMKH